MTTHRPSGPLRHSATDVFYRHSMERVGDDSIADGDWGEGVTFNGYPAEAYRDEPRPEPEYLDPPR